MSIRRLPWEIISYVVQDLDLDDAVNLSMSCRHFQWIVRDDNICRKLLESRVPSAPETRSARKSKQYARAFRILVKRRAAISSASPCLVAVVAKAESFLYSEGVLCYIRSGQLRVLDLHKSASHESVADVGKLLFSDDGLIRPRDGQSFELSLVHFSHGVLSCRYSHRRSHPGWLVVINLAKGRIFSHALETAHKLVVRNNTKFLYYGTHTDVSETGHRRWEFRGCHLAEETWFEHKIRLADIVGSEVGTNICFEIIDGYFYCVANQALFEREEVDWTSYYTYLRFPVNRPPPKSAETVEPEELWRKLHAEGPIDDRWTFLRVVKNDVTGALTVVEGRKEWINASSKSRRTYYTSELRFSQQRERAFSATSATSGGTPESDLYSGSDLDASSDQVVSSPKPETSRSYSRSPHDVHPGDDATSPSTFTITNSLMRAYHASCQAYLDLVNDPLPTDPYQKPRFRLRAGSRRLRPEPEPKGREHSPGTPPDNPLYPEQEINRLYKSSDVVLWPPAHWERKHVADGLRELYDILSPPSHRGAFLATWDDRSICYATGQDEKAVVFVSFDPSIKIHGIKPWCGDRGPTSEAADGCRSHTSSSAVVSTLGLQGGVAEGRPDSREHSREAQLVPAEHPPASSKGKERAVWSPGDGALAADVASHGALPVERAESCSGSVDGPLASADESPRPSQWIWPECPMYKEIQEGFHFMS